MQEITDAQFDRRVVFKKSKKDIRIVSYFGLISSRMNKHLDEPYYLKIRIQYISC